MRALILSLFVLAGCTEGDPFAPQFSTGLDTLTGEWIDVNGPALACDLPIVLSALPDSITIRTRTPIPAADGSMVVRQLDARLYRESVEDAFRTGVYRTFDVRAFDVWLTAWQRGRVTFKQGWTCATPR